MDKKKYQFTGGFTPFQVESKGREGSLHVRPHCCLDLSEDDVRAIQEREPRASRGMYPLPVPKASKPKAKPAPEPEKAPEPEPEKQDEPASEEKKEEKPEKKKKGKGKNRG